MSKITRIKMSTKQSPKRNQSRLQGWRQLRSVYGEAYSPAHCIHSSRPLLYSVQQLWFQCRISEWRCLMLRISILAWTRVGHLDLESWIGDAAKKYRTNEMNKWERASQLQTEHVLLQQPTVLFLDGGESREAVELYISDLAGHFL